MKILTLILTLFASTFALADEAKVTVHLLDHTDEKKTETRFWIDVNEQWRGIVKTKEVVGEQAKQLIAVLDHSLQWVDSRNRCGHDPIYGIELVREDGSTLKTSLCFSCSTWVQPDRRMTIAGEHGINNELCKKLREVIELPVEMLPAAEK